MRTLGEVAPENVYADRDFKYLSEVRRAEAEEWIRSSTPREFSQNFSGEEAYSKALIRLQEGLLTIENLALDTQEQASLSLVNELEANFQLIIPPDEFVWLKKWQNFSSGKDLFSSIMQQLRMLHLRGVVKYPSTDQKFISEANATRIIESAMLTLSSDLVILSNIDEGFRFLLEPEEVKTDYPYLSNNLSEIKNSLEDGGPFPEGGLILQDLIESADENASFEAQELRNELAAVLQNLDSRGCTCERLIVRLLLLLRSGQSHKWTSPLFL